MLLCIAYGLRLCRLRKAGDDEGRGRGEHEESEQEERKHRHALLNRASRAASRLPASMPLRRQRQNERGRELDEGSRPVKRSRLLDELGPERRSTGPAVVTP